MSGIEPFLAAAASAASTAAPYIAAAGAVVSTYGAIQQGKAAQGAADYNAQSALLEGQSRENAQRASASRDQARIRANIGKSGATTAGTPLMVLAESAANAEIDALNTRYTAERQADVYRAGGANARRQGNIMAGTSLLQAAGKFA